MLHGEFIDGVVKKEEYKKREIRVRKRVWREKEE